MAQVFPAVPLPVSEVQAHHTLLSLSCGQGFGIYSESIGKLLEGCL